MVLPLTVLRRLDAVLIPKKPEFLERASTVEGMDGYENALRSVAQAINGQRSVTKSSSLPSGSESLLSRRSC